MGKDSYIVTGNASGGRFAGHGLLAASKKANEFCAAQDKFMIARRTDTTGNAAIFGENSSLIFSCVSASDPEYKRPDMRKDPNVIVQDARNQ